MSEPIRKPAAELRIGDHIIAPEDLEGYVAHVHRGATRVTVRFTDRSKVVLSPNEVVTLRART